MSEMMRVLIGYDGSAASKIVLDDLQRAGLPKRLEAIVITAADVPFPGYAEMAVRGQAELVEEIAASRKRAMDQAGENANEAANRLKTMFPLWNVRSEAHGESPYWALINKAEEWKADLIAVGAHGHSGLGRFMGSVSQLVLMNAPCSVRVVRKSPNKCEHQVLRILVGMDGSPGAEKAVKAAQARAWSSPVSIHVLSTLHSHLTLPVPPLVPEGLRVPRPASGLERQAVIEMVESFARDLRSQERNAEGYVREGDPKRIIVSEAESWNADCIFMGARGISSLRRFLLGGVSMAVAARAHCSVEVVR
jgi:nucleotide-binding universal stress UspA family protein